MNDKHMIEALSNTEEGKIQMAGNDKGHRWRSTLQPLLPVNVQAAAMPGNATYNAVPYHSIGGARIFNGYASLAQWIIGQQTVVIDGFGGVFYEEIQRRLEAEFGRLGCAVSWRCSADYFKPEAVVEAMVKPFLGTENDVWGVRTDLSMQDLFDLDKLSGATVDPEKQVNIFIGPGAALSGWNAPVVYFDIPKSEIQYRMRAKSITNLGKTGAERSFNMYKRFYFVDWVILNNYKQELLDRISIVADGQWRDDVNWMYKEALAAGLAQVSKTVLRVRPWFEKGSWGGQWMKQHFDPLNKEEVNYAWSFELITPENGLVFESDGNLLEISFDFLMLFEYKAVLGRDAETFGPYFPIRFDFLDTFEGGNLSIQCHPSKTYIRERFGEAITQDETYYILDCAPDAKVYLGFQEDINPSEFRKALEDSQKNNEALEVTKYVQSFPSHKHDLFLIPNGTVHSSGVNNMVLEISATPYIFTFKMYDWLSLDLNGKPRPINIEHAFNNLRFERKGEVVARELVSHPVVIESGVDWQVVHLPTHADHFYDVHRLEFDTDIVVDTEEGCHVLMLVEGSAIAIEIKGEVLEVFNYAETFIVPAATQNYKLINRGNGRAKVVKSFIKLTHEQL